jgi:P pilus assembly chaperone PapD
MDDNTKLHGGVGVKLNISIDNCIKLIARPEKINNNMLEYAGNIIWRRDGKDLVASNNSSFYMNIGSLEFDGIRLIPDYIPPKGERRFALKDKADISGIVTWRVIDDYGALSKAYSKKINE